MTFSRRHFLGGSLGFGGLLALRPWQRAWAESVQPMITDRYFVFANFPGGWDTLLALDPRDPDEFTEERIPETGIQPGYNRLPGNPGLIDTAVQGMTFGPFIGDLANHADRLAVVRGMGMSSVAHPTGQRHAITGRLPAGTSVRGSSVATILASLLGADDPIPNLVAGVQSFNLTHPQWSSGLKTNSIEDLYEALKPSETTLAEAERDALERFFTNKRARALSDWERDLLDNRLTARELVNQELATVFDIDQGSTTMLALRERFGVDSGTTGDGGKLALMAAQALTQGVSRCISFRAANNLDTHSGDAWETVQGPNQEAGFNAVAALAAYLADTPYDDGSSWLDHTTIVMLSEFCRRPTLNTQGGRDHYVTNACAMLGGSIRGGQIIGASSDEKLSPQAIHLTSGEVDSSGEFVGFDHIARTLVHSIGVDSDVGDFRVSPITALLE